MTVAFVAKLTDKDRQLEKRRQDTLHITYLTAFRCLLQAILPPHPDRQYTILDLGCGTGIWALDMAFSRPNVKVVGLDIGDAPSDARGRPGNLHFLPGVDFEGPEWPLPEGAFDVVRCGFLAGSVSDWPALLQRIQR